jgi:hypothetical protein
MRSQSLVFSAMTAGLLVVAGAAARERRRPLPDPRNEKTGSGPVHRAS